MKWSRVLGVVLISMISLVLVACGVNGKNPEDVAIAYTEAAYKGDSDTLLKLLNLPKDQIKDGEKEFIEGKIKSVAVIMLAEADSKGGLKKVSVANSDIDEASGVGRVTVTVEFKNKGSEPKQETVPLIRTDDEWKVKI